VVGYDGARARAFFRELVTRVAAQPGVLQVGLARRIPLDANGGGAVRQVTPPDGRALPGGDRLEIRYTSVSALYFSMMGTHVRTGRVFTGDDTEASQKVVVINETMARRYWPNGAVGRSVRVDGIGECLVVGVVQDGKYRSLYEDPDPYMFFPLEQVPSGELTLMVRTDADPAAGAHALREVLRTLDPRMPFMQVLTLEEHARFGSYETRVASTVLGYLGGVGLVLSLTGLYGVVTFVVARRTREIGIRMALGARPRDVFGNVLIRSLTLAGVGAGAGAVLGWLGTRGLARSMYGIDPAEPIMFIATGLPLILVSAGASVWPARRAMRVNPVTALRSE
jgi:predicted permease